MEKVRRNAKLLPPLFIFYFYKCFIHFSAQHLAPLRVFYHQRALERPGAMWDLCLCVCVCFLFLSLFFFLFFGLSFSGFLRGPEKVMQAKRERSTALLLYNDFSLRWLAPAAPNLWAHNQPPPPKK